MGTTLRKLTTKKSLQRMRRFFQSYSNSAQMNHRCENLEDVWKDLALGDLDQNEYRKWLDSETDMTRMTWVLVHNIRMMYGHLWAIPPCPMACIADKMLKLIDAAEGKRGFRHKDDDLRNATCFGLPLNGMVL